MSSEVSDGMEPRSYGGRRPRVAIGHPYLGRGGSEARVMWLIEGLKADCDITVVTTGGWDREALNAYYGTGVSDEDVSVRLAPTPGLPSTVSAMALRYGFYERFARRTGGEYDLCISAYNPTDWGRPAIHFIADVSWMSGIRDFHYPKSPGWIYRQHFLRSGYLWFAKVVQGKRSRDPVSQDQLVANSKWTAGLVQSHYGVGAIAVVHPEVGITFKELPAWEGRRDRVVVLGRVAVEKRIEEAIEIVEGLRSRGHSLELALCGKIPADTYGKRIETLVRSRPWLQVEGSVQGERKAKLLSESKYALSTTSGEGFGIVVAEMMKAGCLVFARNDGGPSEILGQEQLLFADVQDAVGKMDALIRDSEATRRMLSRLQVRARDFGAPKAAVAMRNLVWAMLLRRWADGCEA